MSKNKFQQRLLLGSLLVAAIIISLGILSGKSFSVFEENVRQVEHTREVVAESEKILTLVLNAETSQRGYVITGEEAYLNLFRAVQAQLPEIQEKLRSLISDNPLQHQRVDSLEKLVFSRLALIREVIDIRRNTGFTAAKEKISLNEGDRISGQIRRQIGAIQETENARLVFRKAEADSSYRTSARLSLVATVVVLAITFLLFAYVLFTFKKKVKAEDRLFRILKDLKQVSAENEEKNWILSGVSLVNEALNGEISPEELCESALKVTSAYAAAEVAAFYLADENQKVLRLAAYKAIDREQVPEQVLFGETYTGEVASSRQPVFVEEREGFFVKSALSAYEARSAAFIPLVFNEETKGVLELIFKEGIPAKTRDFLKRATGNIAVRLNAAQSKKRLENLYGRLQVQSEELESQQEELRITNEELNHQTRMLQASEEELRAQQEELRQSNAELEEKAILLEEKNRAVEETREALISKARQLEESNQFKSEFLANMSHELRTPLNSILLLARLLAENKGGRLNEDEAKYARVIYNSGNDLLTLINDILDLAKIESGKVELLVERLSVEEIKTDLQLLFNQVAEEKKINFGVTVAGSVPEFFSGDKMKLEQILRNLLSNAFKFTPEGGKVGVEIRCRKNQLFFTVKDTGIGISAKNQQLIFEAFQQADGSTSRKFGGTGLGLSISRELAFLMKGKIELESEEGKGSTFTFVIPLNEDDHFPDEEKSVKSEKKAQQLPEQHGGNTILIIEDDPNFAEILKDFAKARGFDPYVADTGEKGISEAESRHPMAIILDINLPGMNGWEVLRHLKSRSGTASIPVHIISAGEEDPKKMTRSGAIGFLKKPVDIEQLNGLFNPLSSISVKHNRILVVEDAPEQNDHLRKLFTGQGFEVIQAFDGEQVKQLLEKESFDCMVLDMRLPDINGTDLLDELKQKGLLENLPVVIHTASDLSPADQQKIMKYTSAMVMKTPGSDSRIMDEVKLFIHRIREAGKQDKVSGYLPEIILDKTLKGRKILLVDDDMRNIFALSTALQQYGLEMEIATNGAEALSKLGPSTELVLMDIMMPEMDGYQAIRKIREHPSYKHLPVIALTAKAMKEDRKKSLEAGANDYISKPVDVPALVSAISIWLSQ
jgi:signal transduction histidine kinase/CheY-like chemotaxis protein/CHASE3 domain sensor protein